MPRLDQERLYLQEPTLEDARTDAQGATEYLLVWGQLPAWLVVDEELRTLLGQFDGLRTVRELLTAHARREQRQPEEVIREALPVLEDLHRRRILSPTRRIAPPEPEATSISSVTVNLTNRCNLACPFCYNARRHSPELDVELLMDGIERGRSVIADNASFIILGGEPLLDIERFCTAAKRAEEIFSTPTLVSTNGTLLDEHNVGRLQERRLQVQVSLDSPFPQAHDDLRGQGVYARAVAGIRRLKAASVYTMLSMVYARDSLAQLEAYLELALELGVDEARFIPMRAIGGGVAQVELRPNQLDALQRVLDILERRPELGRLLARDYFSILATALRYSSPRTSCGLGRKFVFIDADGSVYPCPNHVRPDQCAGNLRHDELAQLVREAPVFCAARRRFQVTQYQRCMTCAFRYWCAGDCRGEVLALGGDGSEPSPHCNELRLVYQRLLWLLASGRCPLGERRQAAGGVSVTDTFG